MRIVYLHQYFVTPEMPGGTRSYEMARRLVEAGHQVDLLTTDRGASESGWRVNEHAGIRVHWAGIPYSNHMSYGKRVGAFCRFAWHAARRAITLDADVVFATSTPLTIALPAVYASRRLRVPMVFEVRDLWPEVPIAIGALASRSSIAAARRLERFAYDNAAHIVALSPQMKDGVVEAGVAAKNVTVIPNSCDADRFHVGPQPGQALRKELPWLGDRPMILYAGTLGIANGVEYLARVAAAIRPMLPEARFVVVGGGRQRDHVRAVAADLGVLDETFFMFDQVPKRRVSAFFSAADMATSLFLPLPSLWKNSANKFFDALAASKPVAINYGGWQAKVLDQTGAGCVLDPHDTGAAAARIASALQDQAWLRNAGSASHRLGAERYDRNLLADKLENVLVRAAGGESLIAA